MNLQARSEQIVILHTNDVHDHVRPGYGGLGGLAYISGYVQAQRKVQENLLVLDAGDVTEKGDMVAHRAGGTLTYAAMRRVGYDAITIGNHDNDAGLQALRQYEAALGHPLLCLNRVDDDGKPLFETTRIVRVGAVRVGIIGMLVPQDDGTLSFEDSGAALARESARLASDVDLVVALCHESAANCATWSAMAPAVDLFVTGHAHGEIVEPVHVPSTGAWLIQAGYYARSVGRVELDLDIETGRIAQLRSTRVEMRHDTIPVDHDMAEWIRAKETELCPEADDHVCDATEMLDADELGWLAAEALRRAGGSAAELAFCHAGQVIRDTLPVGPVDVNAVFLTGGFRAHDVLAVSLTGAQVNAYLQALAAQGGDRTFWSGFSASIRADSSGPVEVVSDLESARSYAVIMPEIEWRSRFMRLARRYRERGLGGEMAVIEVLPAPTTIHYTAAMVDLLAELGARGVSLRAAAQDLRDRHGLVVSGLP